MKTAALDFFMGILTLVFLSHPFVLGYYIFSPNSNEIIPAGILTFILESLTLALITIIIGAGTLTRNYFKKEK